MVIGREKGDWREVEVGKGGVNRKAKRLDLGGECKMQYADDVLLRCTLEACMVLLPTSP